MSVTSAKGFVASGVAAGIRRQGRKDLAVVRSVPAAVGAAMFTRNNVQAACLQVSREHLAYSDRELERIVRLRVMREAKAAESRERKRQAQTLKEERQQWQSPR